MKCNLLGNINFQGGVEPDACSSQSNQMSLIMAWRSTRTVVGLRFDLAKYQVEFVWNCDLTGNVYHHWAGHRIAMNSASLISGVENRLYAVGGTDRFLLNNTIGTIIVHASAQNSPTAPASLVGDELIVPEGQVLVGYDADSLNLKWSSPTPNHQWIFSPSAENFAILQDERSQTASLWNFRTDTLWILPKISYPTQAMIVSDNIVVIASGGSSTKQLVAFNLKTGSEEWSNNYYLTRDTSKESIENCPSSRYLVIEENGVIIAATVKPTLEAISLTSGMQLWSVNLISQPIALAKNKSLVWISTVTGDIISVDITSGTILDSVKVQGQPVSILPTSDESAIVLLRLGSICYISP